MYNSDGPCIGDLLSLLANCIMLFCHMVHGMKISITLPFYRFTLILKAIIRDKNDYIQLAEEMSH